MKRRGGKKIGHLQNQTGHVQPVSETFAQAGLPRWHLENGSYRVSEGGGGSQIVFSEHKSQRYYDSDSTRPRGDIYRHLLKGPAAFLI